MENFAKIGMIAESQSLLVAEKRLDKLADTSDKTTAATDRGRKATEKKTGATTKATAATAAASAAQAKQTATARAAAIASEKLAIAQAKVATAATAATAKMGGLGGIAGNIGRNFLAATVAMVGFSAATGSIVRFEDAMAKVGGVTNATAVEMGQLRDIAKELGASTEFSASQVGDGLSFLGMAGFDAAESIAAMPAVLDLATAGQLDLGRAADISSNIMSGFGIEATNATGAIDIMAKVATSSNTNISQLGSAIGLVGPVANAAGIELKEVAAAVGVLGDAGIQGTRAGTSLRQAIGYLVDPADDARAAIEELGLSTEELNPQSNSLVAVFSKLGNAGLDTARAMRIFGMEGSAGALRLASASDELDVLTQMLGNVDGAAKTMADRFRDTLGGSLREMRSAAEGLALAVGEAGLTAALTTLAKGITGLLRAVTAGISGVTEFAKSLDGLGLAAKAVAALFTVRLISRFGLLKKAVDLAKVGVTGLAIGMRGLATAGLVMATALSGFNATALTNFAFGVTTAKVGTVALAGAMKVLGGAVRIAGGPWGLLATGVFTAASYLGLFGGASETATTEIDRTKEAVDRLNTALGNFNDDKSEVTAENALSIARAMNEETQSTLAAAAAHHELTVAKMAALRTNLSSNPLTADVESTGYGADLMAEVEAAAKRVAKAQEEADMAALSLEKTLATVQGRVTTAPVKEMEDAIVNLANAMETLESRTEAFTGLADISTAPIDDLMDKYGVLAEELREPLKLQLEIAEANAIDAARDVGKGVAQQFNLALSELSLEEPTRKIIGPLELTNAEVEKLRIGIFGITQSTGPEELATNIAKVATELGRAYGNAEQIPAPMRELLNSAINAAREVGLISQRANDATRNISSASGAAASLANNLSTALGNIAAIANTNISLNLDVVGLTAQNKALSEGKDKYDAMADAAIATRRAQLDGVNGIGSQVAEVREAAESQLALTEQLERDKARLARDNSALTATVSSGGGGGGSGTSKQQEEVERLAEAYDSLMSSLDPAYEKMLNLRDAEDMLTSAVNAGIIGVEEKARATDLLRESYEDLGGVGTTVRDMLSDTFSSIITGASSAKEAIAQLATALANMAFQKGFEQLFDSSGATGFLGDFFGNVLGWNARGTDNWRGGLSVVGEEGPEIVNLPKGTQIFSNQNSRRMIADAKQGMLGSLADIAKDPVTPQELLPQPSRALDGIPQATAAQNSLAPTQAPTGARQMGSAASAGRLLPETDAPGIIFGTKQSEGSGMMVARIRDAVVEALPSASVSRETFEPTVNFNPNVVVNQEAGRLPPANASATSGALGMGTPAGRDAKQSGLLGSTSNTPPTPAITSFAPQAPIPPAPPSMMVQQQPAAAPNVNVQSAPVEVKVEPKIYFDRDAVIGGFMNSPKGRHITMTSVEEEGAQR